MSDIGYGVSSTGSLEDALKAMPADLGSYMRSGFNILATTNPRDWPFLFATVKVSTRYAGETELEPVAQAIGIDTDRVGALLNALRLVLSIVAYRNDHITEVVQASIAAKILDAADADKLKNFLENAAVDRPHLKQQLEQSALQHAVLPSLSLAEFAVDLRLGFDKKTNELVSAAPVAVVHIDTDAIDSEIWFQMTPLQVESIHKELGNILLKLKAAEGLAKKLT